MTILKNAVTAQTTPTYDLANMVVHSTIIDFKVEHAKDTWGGYRYWLGITPFPADSNGFGLEKFENPSPLGSNDGINWELPSNLPNPLDNANTDVTNAYNSDIDIIYNANDDCIYAYYREYKKLVHTKIFLIKVNEDHTISAPIECITNLWGEGYDLLSPCVWKESAGNWHMWGVNMRETDGFLSGIGYKTSLDGITWSATTIFPNPFDSWRDRWEAWHVSCKPNVIKNRVEFCFNIKKGEDFRLTYAECEIDKPTELRLPFNDFILSPNLTGWDSNRIYRSGFVIDKDSVGRDIWKLWYTAYGNNLHDRHLGYTEGIMSPHTWVSPKEGQWI